MNEKIRIYFEDYPNRGWRAWSIVYGQRVEVFGETKDQAREKIVARATQLLRQNASSIEEVEIPL